MNYESSSASTRRSFDGDATEDGGAEERDESKRKSRNLSEKKRRDQFNNLINELCSMVSTSSRKMDKATVLKATIAFFKAHNDMTVQSQHETLESSSWKPSFLSNEEFKHLMLEALDGFIMVISSEGIILYVSESIIPRLGHLPSDLQNSTIYDWTLPVDLPILQELLMGPFDDSTQEHSVIINLRLGGLEINEEETQTYQRVSFYGYFKPWISDSESSSGSSTEGIVDDQTTSDANSGGSSYIFVGLCRLLNCDLLRATPVVVSSAKDEFSSRHSMEWKFLFLDHRAPPIIGYLPFEVLGTSGYDYYHVDDLEKIATCHELLMQKGEGTSCFYRFLTKGHQWIWLQTRFYITYHQWNSKPDISCTHKVVSYVDIMKDVRGKRSNVESASLSGPSLPKQAKVESKNSVCFSSSSLSIKNTRKTKSAENSLSFESMTSNRNYFNPRKASSTITSAQAVSELSQNGKCQTVQCISDSAQEPAILSVPSLDLEVLNTSATVALQPQVPQFSQSRDQDQQQQQVTNINNNNNNNPATANAIPCNMQNVASMPIAMSLANFNVIPIAQNPNLPITSNTLDSRVLNQMTPRTSSFGIQQGFGGPPIHTSPQSNLHDQLLMKHAELQAKIIRQQEELRRVSEQLLVAQFNSMQGPVFVPTTATSANPPPPPLQQPPHYLQQHMAHDPNQQQQLMNDNSTTANLQSNLFPSCPIFQTPVMNYPSQQQQPSPSGDEGAT